MDFTRDILPLKNVLFRTALRITMNREEAEDIVQDTLLKLWERHEELSSVSNLESFAISAARNLALDRIALHQNKVITLNEELHDTADSSVSVHEQLVMGERTDMLHQLISQLPEKQRTALHLRDIEGKTYREIGEIMGISESDVKINIYRGRDFLKKNFKNL
ncbi:MAG: RNA polymerase sigma factor [Bacteroidaceae bacterium]|nr:RNA polymerase sigma factor [Bacteroidaceae bacterium]MBP5523395.1 RNA polymerase sigma factor [Bacteroidaceae bacterium]